MAIHDAWARRTPYELFLPDEDFAEERFPPIRAEAEERGADLSDPEMFPMLMAAGEALGELRGPDDDAERIRQHGLLLFHAWHFRDSGEPLWLLSTPAARYLVEASEAPGAVEPPTDAGYLQLPQHLFWGRDESAAGGAGQPAGERPTPQSVDGIFWTAGDGRLSVLAVLGVRGDRPGFSVVPLSSLPLADAPSWAVTDMREEGEDFRSDMPGAEIEALYEIRTAGELLKLLVRAWALTDPAAAERHEPPESADSAEASKSAEGPTPSRLPFYRISLT